MKSSKSSSHQNSQTKSHRSPQDNSRQNPPYSAAMQAEIESFLKSLAPTALEKANQLTNPELIRTLLEREKRKTVIKALKNRLETLTKTNSDTKQVVSTSEKIAAQFVELPFSDRPTREILLEALHPNGSRLKLTLKTGDEQVLLSLAEAFWSQDR